ncbi:MAG: hypothetical protein WAO83_20485 [Fuerstiella sp.]
MKTRKMILMLERKAASDMSAVELSRIPPWQGILLCQRPCLIGACCVVLSLAFAGSVSHGQLIGLQEPPVANEDVQVFKVSGLPLTFHYPATWSKPQEGKTVVISGPKGYRDIPLEVKVCPVPKADHPDSSAWKQVIRAQDQLTRQDGLLLAMSERALGEQQVPYVLVGFPMGKKAEGLPVLNVLQFVVDHDETYYWICFSGPSDVWESNSTVLKGIFESVRFSDNNSTESNMPRSSTAAANTSWTAERVRKAREKAATMAAVPEDVPHGWSKSRVDPQKLVTLFPPIQLKAEYRLRAFQYSDELGNGNGFVWAMPANAEFPEPDDCPVVVTHFLKPPKPPTALDDFMEAIKGDDSPNSYLAASLLARELREFGATWHGLDWTTHVVLDADPFMNPPAKQDSPLAPMDRPNGGADAFKWHEERPSNWKPHVEITADSVQVTFYTFSGLDKQAIYRHVDYFRPGSLRFTSLQKVVAESPGGFAF